MTRERGSPLKMQGYKGKIRRGKGGTRDYNGLE